MRGGRRPLSSSSTAFFNQSLLYRINHPPILCFAEKGGDPELLRESQRRRYADVGLVDKVLELDEKWRTGKL